MPLALYLPPAAWTALAGLGGAAIGACAGGFIDWRLECWRERKRAKAGARLLAADISMGASQLSGAERERRWMGYYEFRPTIWNEYRDVLATTLEDDFEVVSQAVRVMIEVFEKMLAAPVWPKDVGYMALPDEAVEGLGRIQAEAADAYNALADLAGHSPVTDKRIHADGD